ncbi:hypothetical protein JCM10213v2_007647 [Rhodosporidiobolus nylandii]
MSDYEHSLLTTALDFPVSLATIGTLSVRQLALVGVREDLSPATKTRAAREFEKQRNAYRLEAGSGEPLFDHKTDFPCPSLDALSSVQLLLLPFNLACSDEHVLDAAPARFRELAEQAKEAAGPRLELPFSVPILTFDVKRKGGKGFSDDDEESPKKVTFSQHEIEVLSDEESALVLQIEDLEDVYYVEDETAVLKLCASKSIVPTETPQLKTTTVVLTISLSAAEELEKMALLLNAWKSAATMVQDVVLPPTPSTDKRSRTDSVRSPSPPKKQSRLDEQHTSPSRWGERAQMQQTERSSQPSTQQKQSWPLPSRPSRSFPTPASYAPTYGPPPSIDTRSYFDIWPLLKSDSERVGWHPGLYFRCKALIESINPTGAKVVLPTFTAEESAVAAFAASKEALPELPLDLADVADIPGNVPGGAYAVLMCIYTDKHVRLVYCTDAYPLLRKLVALKLRVHECQNSIFEALRNLVSGFIEPYQVPPQLETFTKQLRDDKVFRRKTFSVYPNGQARVCSRPPPECSPAILGPDAAARFAQKLDVIVANEEMWRVQYAKGR